MTSDANSFSISLTNLSKRFNREWIFRHFSYRFSSGNVYAITGPNGSGKSTLLQILWGQVPPSSGNIEYLLGENVVPVDDIFSHISIATPYMELIEEFTLLEQIQFHFQLKQLRPGVSIDELLSILYLENARDKYISNFSSGMKQRLKLGLAFYSQCDALFLDEPGSHLDKTAFDWYQREFERLPKNLTLFVGSNNPEEYPSNAERIYLPDLKG